ncbi:hypothetical protein TWF569_005570 [Orbilia oligospora]|uniref:Methyltransferase n=1 Tax=Orbilia oligospora TaxID=2813651 RepID=A0A7C8J6R8_ORBOL|nr:hypothetical protein TWF102_009630 [Orbilia oligospora]KAF3115783.1 hypothetical protein TWF706_005883 [Orbilia oligospora]KAF3118045.1 hypothetical protein TWF103_000079 [Orbilia oligospora]KAF3156589.1 hypothetical protein TWF569_005570 [Orbilia oligospora]
MDHIALPVGNNSTQASVLYLKRLDLYRTQKPYEILFSIKDLNATEAQQTNCELEPHVIQALDAEYTRSNFSITKNGFQFANFPTKMKPTDFNDEKMIKEIYYREVKECLQQIFPEKIDVRILDHQRRRRNPVFPIPTNEGNGFLQPVPTVHTDFSSKGIALKTGSLQRLLDAEPDLQNRTYKVINVWRRIAGAPDDWPLAVCDYQSLNLRTDVEEVDRVAQNSITASNRFYHNPRHSWYFLKKQSYDDVTMFCNCDSRGPRYPFSPHAALEIKHPDSEGETEIETSYPPRESIEVRAFCFF